MLTPVNTIIHALFYGDYHELHKRLIKSLCLHSDPIHKRVWCNQVCDKTKELLARIANNNKTWTVMFSEENVPKYLVMRHLFEAYKKPEGERWECDWAIWFDDDSYISDPRWWSIAKEKLESSEADYLGQPWFIHYRPGQEEFIKESPWYKGLGFQTFPTKSKKKLPGVEFAQGAYWWLSTDAIRELDWPDTRLSHNGGDTLLGEAVRQNQLTFCKFNKGENIGVVINNAKRRGRSDPPAGCSNKSVRI